MTATATVHSLRLTPIAAAVIAPPVLITSQSLADDAADYRAQLGAGRSYMAESLRSTVRRMTYAASELADVGIEQIKTAIKGATLATRTAIVAADGKRKYEDGPDTADTRKFFSMAKAIFGALRSGRLTSEAFETADNAQHLYDLARELLSGDAEAGVPALDWTGEATLDAAEKAERKANKARADADAKALESAAILGMTPEQVADLRAKAQEVADAELMAAELAAFDSRAKKAAETLAEKLGSVIRAREYVARMAAHLDAMQ